MSYKYKDTKIVDLTAKEGIRFVTRLFIWHTLAEAASIMLVPHVKKFSAYINKKTEEIKEQQNERIESKAPKEAGAEVGASRTPRAYRDSAENN